MHLNDNLRRVVTSPITEAYGWVEGRGVSSATARGDASEEDATALLDVSQAVPGYPPPRELREHVAEMARRDDAHGYTEQLGLAALRQELAGRVSRLYDAAVPIDPGQVGITAGCNQAFCLVVSALAAPGDEVVLPAPYYFNHDMWLRAQGVVPVYLPCDAAQQPRLELLPELLGARTRALVLVTPNNPTGAVYSEALLQRVFALCADAGIALVVDETYRDFLPGGHREARADASATGAAAAVSSAPGPAAEAPHGLFRDPRWDRTLVQLYSFSKVYCLAGYRVGAIVGSPALLEQVAKVMDCVAICPPRLAQEAALYGLRHLDSWVSSNRDEMAARLEAFHAALDAAPGGEAAGRWKIAGSGAYFAYVRHPWDGIDSRTAARHLARRHRILALAGGMFGPGQERYLRVAFANLGRQRIDTLAQRLGSCAGDPPREVVEQPVQTSP